MRHTGQEGVKADRHYATRLGALLVKNVKLTANGVGKLFGRMALANEGSEIIGFGRIGNRD